MADGAPIRKRWGKRRSQVQTTASCQKRKLGEARGSLNEVDDRDWQEWSMAMSQKGEMLKPR